MIRRTLARLLGTRTIDDIEHESRARQFDLELEAARSIPNPSLAYIALAALNDKLDEQRKSDDTAARKTVRSVCSIASVLGVVGISNFGTLAALGGIAAAALFITPFLKIVTPALNYVLFSPMTRLFNLYRSQNKQFKQVLSQAMLAFEDENGDALLADHSRLSARYPEFLDERLQKLFNRESVKQQAKDEDLGKIHDGIEAPLSTPRQRLTLRRKNQDSKP